MPYTREVLSGAPTGGRGILLTGTATGSSVTIHTAQSGTALVDVVSLYASNFADVTRRVTIEWGGTTSPNDLLTFDIPAKAVTYLVSDLPIQNSLVIKGWCDVANIVSIFGFVNREA